MIKIIAVDDEKHVLERFARIAGDFPDVEICGLFEKAENALNFLDTHVVDAVFLDIEMPGSNGLELSERILEACPETEIVFVTAFNHYAVEAFELNALDYILKPVSAERIRKSINRISVGNVTSKEYGEVYIQCFGRFTISKNGQPIICKNSKAEEILAFLVHHEGKVSSWEKIIDAVWPNFNFEKAHANFHSTTYLLRKFLTVHELAHIFEYSRGQYRIRTEKIDCDLLQFKKLCTQIHSISPKESIMEKINELYTGEYLAENSYTWSYAKAIELERMYKKHTSTK